MIALVAVPSVGVCQVGPDSATAVEVLAARAMLAHAGVPKSRIAIEPSFAKDGAAPPASTTQARSTTRNDALAVQLRASVMPMSAARRCPKCELSAADVVLHLSDPLFTGTEATITVTASFNGRRGHLNYRTVRYTLSKRGVTWEISKSDELGVT
jgi:hypothetical protein